jgi:hypothetical protein
MTTDRDDIIDPVLAQLLREAADESPPAHVDAAILAAARREVEPPHRRRSAAAPVWRWLLPLGAAATIAAIVISFQPLAPTPVEETSSAADAPAPQADRSAPVERTAPPASANALAPAPAKEQARGIVNSRSSASPVESRREQPAQRQEARKPAAAAAPAAVAAAPRQDAATRADAGHDAAAWIERIRTLLRESRLEEAARELERFHAAFADADARLPEDLRAFAAQSRTKPVAPR